MEHLLHCGVWVRLMGKILGSDDTVVELGPEGMKFQVEQTLGETEELTGKQTTVRILRASKGVTSNDKRGSSTTLVSGLQVTMMKKRAACADKLQLPVGALGAWG